MRKFKGFLFWLASLTWGLPMTLIGLLFALALLVTGHKPHRFHWLIYFEVGDAWGGFNLGAVFIVGKGVSLHTKQHESGHGLQNIMFGVFMPFLVGIPSAIRYWYREYLTEVKKKPYSSLPPYDSAWYEGMATKLGEKYFKQ